MDAIGLLAAACVLATFCMKSMMALRAFALASNVLFIVYGAGANLFPIVVLHAILLPINGWSLGRLWNGRPGALTLGVAAAIISCVLAGTVVAPSLASEASLAIGTMRSFLGTADIHNLAWGY